MRECETRPTMPELEKNQPAFGMNGIDHLSPSPDLLL